jgi:SAM-dependent methyltransferase
LPLGVLDHSRWSVEGVEISPELSRFIEGKLGIRCHTGTLESLGLPGGSYDFIVCHDLIEHINQPGRFLSELGRILKPGGRIQIITPNGYQDLAFPKRAYRAGTPVTMLLNHIIFFTPKTLRLALSRAGLRTRKLYCYDVRYALKDFGVFGMGKPRDIPEGPSMKEASGLELTSNLPAWNSGRIAELRSHRKVSLAYGFWRESLPRFFTPKISGRIGVGHEIYALAESNPSQSPQR